MGLSVVLDNMLNSIRQTLPLDNGAVLTGNILFVDSQANLFQNELNQTVNSKNNITDKNQKKIDNIQGELDTIKEQVVVNNIDDSIPTSQPTQHVDSTKISDKSDFKTVQRILKKIDEQQLPKVLKAIDKIPKADLTEVLDAIKTTSKKDTKSIIRAINKIPKTELKDLVHDLPKTDLSSVLTAISKIPKTDLSDVLAAIKDIPKTDLVPVLSAIDNIPKQIPTVDTSGILYNINTILSNINTIEVLLGIDKSEVLQAIANIPETDISEVLEAIYNLPRNIPTVDTSDILYNVNYIKEYLLDFDNSEVLQAIANIPETDLSGVLTAIQGIPTTDISSVLTAIANIPEADLSAVLSEIQDLPTNVELSSTTDDITGAIMGSDYLANSAAAKTVPELIGEIESKIDEITGAINTNCPAPVSGLEEAIGNLESFAGNLLADGIVSDAEYDSFQVQLQSFQYDFPNTGWSTETKLKVANINNNVLGNVYMYELTIFYPELSDWMSLS